MFVKFRSWINSLFRKNKYRRYGEKEYRKKKIAGQLFSFAVIIAGGGYLGWCILNVQWKHWYIAVPFLVTEFLFFILFLLWTNVLWNKRYHRPAGPPLEKRNYSVDILIPVCREHITFVQATVRAAMEIQYASKQVYVLDDGPDPDVKKLCEELGVHYLSRPTHENRKAGNLNFGLSHSNGDLVLTLDADQVANPEILDHVVGYFTIPYMGFVQTKQKFILPEGDPWGNADEVFYQVMQPGKDYDNTAISCGSGVVYRRSALESVGGFSTWNFVEDLYTSLLLHDKGWRSVYHGVSYTTGTAPAEVVGHVKQRWQWAVDSLRLFFWDNPLFKKGLNFKQKLQYLHFGYHYFIFGLFLPIFFLLPIFALFTHQFMLHEPFWRYFIARFPYFFLYMLSNKITTDKLHSFKVFQAQAGLFAVYFSASFAALFSRKKLPQYRVTEKVSQKQHIIPRIRACLPHILIVIMTITAMVWGVVTITDDFWFLAVNLFWATWTIMVLWRFIWLSLFQKVSPK